MFQAVSIIKVNEGSVDEFIEAAKPVAEGVRKQEGCISYNVFIPDEVENGVCVLEVWESRELFEAHVKSGYTEGDPLFGLGEKFGPMFAEAPNGLSGDVAV